jgi:hypothetical protein
MHTEYAITHNNNNNNNNNNTDNDDLRILASARLRLANRARWGAETPNSDLY